MAADRFPARHISDESAVAVVQPLETHFGARCRYDDPHPRTSVAHNVLVRRGRSGAGPGVTLSTVANRRGAGRRDQDAAHRPRRSVRVLPLGAPWNGPP